MTEPAAVSRPALPRRLAAMLYDTLLVLPLIMVSVALAMAVRALFGLGPSAEGIVRLNPYLVQLIAALTVMAFFSWFWLKNGQTLGMQAWRIKLVGFDGSPPGVLQVVRRCFGAALSAACLGLGYLWCLVDRNGRYWHDYLSATELVLLPGKKAKKRSAASNVPGG
jgi:uncharacterized RDD family membrane protein YckC